MGCKSPNFNHPLPDAGVGLELLCSSGSTTQYSNILFFFPTDDQVVALTLKWKSRAPEPYPGTNWGSPGSASQCTFNQTGMWEQVYKIVLEEKCIAGVVVLLYSDLQLLYSFIKPNVLLSFLLESVIIHQLRMSSRWVTSPVDSLCVRCPPCQLDGSLEKLSTINTRVTCATDSSWKYLLLPLHFMYFILVEL